MITDEEFFIEKNILLFEPYDGIEFIYTILQNTGHNNFKSIEARDYCLKVLKKLFDMDIIEIFSWGERKEQLKNSSLSKEEKLNFIKDQWFVGADFPDFFNMPMFKYKDWYIKGLEKEGMDQMTNWESFVSNKIGGIKYLSSWIKEHRPAE